MRKHYDFKDGERNPYMKKKRKKSSRKKKDLFLREPSSKMPSILGDAIKAVEKEVYTPDECYKLKPIGWYCPICLKKGRRYLFTDKKCSCACHTKKEKTKKEYLKRDAEIHKKWKRVYIKCER